MADIYHDFPIVAEIEKVFDVLASPEGMSMWWTLSSSGKPEPGNLYTLDFGPDYQWTGRVTECVRPTAFEIELVEASEDWQGSHVRFDLEDREYCTMVSFRHSHWPEISEHYRISSYCWAMYLRIMKRYIEHGEEVPYKDRLNV